jgi:hypothetical protein
MTRLILIGVDDTDVPGSPGTGRVARGLIVLLVLVALLLACSNESASGSAPTSLSSPAANPTTSPPPASGEGYAVTIVQEGKALARLSLADLKALPQVTVTAGGREQTGPTISTVIAMAKVKEYSAVVVVGQVQGRYGTGELRLTRAQVTDRVLLDINNRGQTKLASPDIPAERWVVDVTELRVE